MPYTVKLANGQFLTGKTWRKDPLFGSLPFITALLQDDDMVQALEVALAPAIENNDGRGNTALIVCNHFIPPLPSMSPLQWALSSKVYFCIIRRGRVEKDVLPSAASLRFCEKIRRLIIYWNCYVIGCVSW